MPAPVYSIVIPVYNEEKRIPKNIDTIFSFFQAVPEEKEIIFVDDGSKDRTRDLLEQYQKQYTFQIITYAENKGKGHAVRRGALEAKGEWIIFFDIDLATPLEEFYHLQSFITPGDRVIIGSRRLAASSIERSESKLRTFLGHSFTKLSNILVPRVTDFTCGFKCFSREAAATIFPRARIDRWGFDTELLYIAVLHHLSIREMPVRWAHDSQSKVRVLWAVCSSLRELLEMKIHQWKGRYT